MSNQMTSADVPVHLGEAITLEIKSLEDIINGTVPSLMILTRSNKKMLKKIFVARSENKFEYGQFLVIKKEEYDDWSYIMMNDYIKSPQYWSEEDFQELRN